MFDARVVRSREDEVYKAELANRVQPLKLQRLEQIEGERLKADRSVDRVGDRLQIRHRPCDVRERINNFVRIVWRKALRYRGDTSGASRPRSRSGRDGVRQRGPWRIRRRGLQRRDSPDGEARGRALVRAQNRVPIGYRETHEEAAEP